MPIPHIVRTNAAFTARLLVGGLFLVSCPPPVHSRTAAVPAPHKPGPASWVIEDAGRARLFLVAMDEVSAVMPDGRWKIYPVTKSTSLDELRQRSLAVQRDIGAQAGLVLYESGMERNAGNRRFLTKQVLVREQPGGNVSAAASAAGAAAPSPVRFAPGYYIVDSPEIGGAPDLAARLRSQPGVLTAEPLLARQQAKRRIPNDPLFTNQWHLLNTGQKGGTATMDVRVTNTWDTYRGEGILIGIVDDGLQATHPDLAHSDTTLDWDFNDNDPDPSPSVANEDFHGTACAGVAAALGSNGIGVAGVAFRATPVGLRLIGAPTTDAQEAEALNHSNALIWIKSNSWGPQDDAIRLEGPGILTKTVFEQAVATGRNGLGTIFLWAGGNGYTSDDSNKDGYANLIQTIAVGAINDRGARCNYSEPGANLVIGAPSGDSALGRQDITTVDLAGNDGYNTISSGVSDYSNRDYTKTFSGTSSATPLAAGVVALILQANPGLGWRDVQEILIRSAVKNSPADTQWTTNAAGFHFNHQFGAGLICASGAVALAQGWTNLGPQVVLAAQGTNRNAAIPDNNTNGVLNVLALPSAGLRVEHATVTVDIDHRRRGDLEVTLTSPSGMRSTLVHTNADPMPDYKQWTFMSVRHWGESAAGTWIVRVADRRAGTNGTWRAATLTLYGTASGGILPLPVMGSALSDDSAGNNNGALDPGEIIAERIALQNLGGDATGVTTTLVSTHAQVILLQDMAVFPAFAAGMTVTNDPAFVYQLDQAIPCGTVVTLQHVTAYSGVAVTALITRTVGAPQAYDIQAQTFESTDLPKKIPDRGTAFSTLMVARAGAPVIDDLDVAIRINHRYPSDLQIALRHPDGTEVLLSNQNGGLGSHFGTGTNCASATRTEFDDEADESIVFGTPPFAGRYQPERSLSAFDGKPLNGTWVLRVSDMYSSDLGTAICWSVSAVSHLETNLCTVVDNDDLDGDGIPDAWEFLRFTNLTTATASSDYDGDKILDAEEAVALTDPHDPFSFPRVAELQVDDMRHLFFLGASGRLYQVEFATNLEDRAEWRQLANEVPGSNSVQLVADTNAAPSRFYRVRVRRP